MGDRFSIHELLEPASQIKSDVPRLFRFQIARNAFAFGAAQRWLQKLSAQSVSLSLRLDSDQQQVPMLFWNISIAHELLARYNFAQSANSSGPEDLRNLIQT
jgi:hypothetical protein